MYLPFTPMLPVRTDLHRMLVLIGLGDHSPERLISQGEGKPLTVVVVLTTSPLTVTTDATYISWEFLT